MPHRRFLRKGDIVVATLRTPSVLAPLSTLYSPSQLLILQLDVSRPSDISAAFARTQDVFGRLDVVFNNAGYSMVGEVETTSDSDARALFEVNFWGAVGVSRAAVRFFREVNPPGKGGVILQNSSVSGFLAPPGMAFYCARYVSSNLARSTPTQSPLPAYVDTVTAIVRYTIEEMSFDGDPYKFAETLYRIVVGARDGKKIPLFLPIGEDALEMLQDRVKRMDKVVVNVAPWSADLKKDGNMDKALEAVMACSSEWIAGHE